MVFGLKPKTSAYSDSFQAVDSSDSELFDLEDRNVGRSCDSEGKPRSRSRSAARKIAATMAKLTGKVKSEAAAVEHGAEQETPSTRRRWLSSSTEFKKATTAADVLSEPTEDKWQSKLETKLAGERPSRLPAPSRDGYEEDSSELYAAANRLSGGLLCPSVGSDDEASDNESVVSNVISMFERKSDKKHRSGRTEKSPTESPHKSRASSKSRTVMRKDKGVPPSDGDTANEKQHEDAVSEQGTANELRPVRSPSKQPRRRLRSKTPEIRHKKSQEADLEVKSEKDESPEMSPHDTDTDTSEGSSCSSPNEKRGLLDTSNHSFRGLSNLISRQGSSRMLNSSSSHGGSPSDKSMSKSGSLRNITGILKGSNHGNGLATSKWGNSSVKQFDLDSSVHSKADQDMNTAQIDEELEMCLIATLSASASNLGVGIPDNTKAHVQQWRENRLRGPNLEIDRSRRSDNGASLESRQGKAEDEQNNEPERRSRETSESSDRVRGRSRGSKQRTKSEENPEVNKQIAAESKSRGVSNSNRTSSSRAGSSTRIRGSSHQSKNRTSSRRQRSKSKARSDKHGSTESTNATREESASLPRAKSDHTRSEVRVLEPSKGISTSEHVGRSKQQSRRGSASSSRCKQSSGEPGTPVKQRSQSGRQTPSTQRLKLTRDFDGTPTKPRRTTDVEYDCVEALMPELKTTDLDNCELDLLPHVTPKSERAFLRSSRTPTSASRQRSKRSISKSPKPVKTSNVVEGLEPTTPSMKPKEEVGSSTMPSTRQTSERNTRSKSSRTSGGEGHDDSK